MPVRPKLRGADARLLKGYAPLVGLIVFFAAIVVLVPSVARERIETAGTGSQGGFTPGGGQTGATVPGADGTTGGATTGGSSGGGGGGGAGGGGGGEFGGVPGGAPCPDGRTLQVPTDTYSPPCIDWPAGSDNGGVTAQGVSGETIRLGFRLTTDPGISGVLSYIGDARIPRETEEDIRRTAYGLVDYFNANFQMYGRKIEIVEFQGRGSQANEILGAGQDLANNDAIKAAKELDLFGDVSAFTEPYASALVREGVMAFGPLYQSRQWFEAQNGYAWSVTPDCTNLVELNTAALVGSLGQPAIYAGGSVKGQPRKAAIIAPNTPVYQDCANAALNKFRAGGADVEKFDYTLDLTSSAKQASDIMDQLMARNVTTVLLGCDPFLIINLAIEAKKRNYFPEWVVVGVVLSDADMVAQLFQQDEWAHAFGVSMLGPQQDRRSGYGYAAYKSVHPESEPSITVDLFYFQIYQAVIGIQMAGPNLTPATFRDGMFRYPGGTGLAGTWHFGPGDYTAQDDGMIVYWDPNATSQYNGAQGAYIQASERFTAATAPAQLPPLPIGQ